MPTNPNATNLSYPSIPATPPPPPPPKPIKLPPVVNIPFAPQALRAGNLAGRRSAR